VGTIRKGALDIVRDKIDLGQIRVLAESDAYPGWVYASRAGFNPAHRERIARAMFALDKNRPEDRAILAEAGMVGIIPAKDRDYESIRRLARRLNLSEDAP
jgi:phosphonate transport system substrate-binding protein